MTAQQRIVRVRRQYNQWVANQTLEDYALRFTAKSARRWSAARVANTAIGAISFLALEAIGGTITLNYGVTNASAAILVVSVSSSAHRPADRLLRRQIRHRHRPAHPRRRLRLYRLDHHLADLRLLHLHLLRHRGGDPVARRWRCASASRCPLGYLISAGRDHPAGHPRHHADQPLSVVDAAGLDRAASSCPFVCDRLGQSALLRTMDELLPGEHGDRAASLRSRCCSAPRRRWCSRWWRKSASRSTSCASCRATAATSRRRGGSR